MAAAPGGLQWQFENPPFSGKFQDYGEIENLQLNDAYESFRKGDSRKTYDIIVTMPGGDKVLYEINFERMVQIQKGTNKTRRIRIRPQRQWQYEDPPRSGEYKDYSPENNIEVDRAYSLSQLPGAMEQQLATLTFAHGLEHDYIFEFPKVGQMKQINLKDDRRRRRIRMKPDSGYGSMMSANYSVFQDMA